MSSFVSNNESKNLVAISSITLIGLIIVSAVILVITQAFKSLRNYRERMNEIKKLKNVDYFA